MFHGFLFLKCCHSTETNPGGSRSRQVVLNKAIRCQKNIKFFLLPLWSYVLPLLYPLLVSLLMLSNKGEKIIVKKLHFYMEKQLKSKGACAFFRRRMRGRGWKGVQCVFVIAQFTSAGTSKTPKHCCFNCLNSLSRSTSHTFSSHLSPSSSK